MSVSLADLAKGPVETYLSTRSYVTGFSASQDDAALLALVGSPDAKKAPHTFRWAKHINAFTAEERKAWPAGKGAVTLDAPKADRSRSKSPAKGGKAASPAKKEEKKPAPKVAAAEEEDDDDLFAEDEAADRAREERLKAIADKAKAAKPEKEKPKQRSLIKLEIKPNEVETDLEAMAKRIKAEVTHPGIQNWGDQHKLEPVAFGIFKLLINVVVFDDDIMVDDIEEMLMEKFGEEIQSVDVAAMSKV